MSQYCETFGKLCTGCMGCQDDTEPFTHCAGCGDPIVKGQLYYEVEDNDYCTTCVTENVA